MHHCLEFRDLTTLGLLRFLVLLHLLLYEINSYLMIFKFPLMLLV